jgi:hypothetical protein
MFRISCLWDKLLFYAQQLVYFHKFINDLMINFKSTSMQLDCYLSVSISGKIYCNSIYLVLEFHLFNLPAPD